MSLPLTKLIINKKKKKPRLKDPNTSNYNEFNVLHPRVRVILMCIKNKNI
jgi:hypothetical protein